MATVADKGILYRWRGVIATLAGILTYNLMRPWLRPWLNADPSHIWLFVGSIFTVWLGVLVFSIWRRVRRGELQL
jgi:Na+/melibiose symporter-like transporter